jgi:hypothetical protein
MKAAHAARSLRFYFTEEAKSQAENFVLARPLQAQLVVNCKGLHCTRVLKTFLIKFAFC